MAKTMTAPSNRNRTSPPWRNDTIADSIVYWPPCQGFPGGVFAAGNKNPVSMIVPVCNLLQSGIFPLPLRIGSSNCRHQCPRFQPTTLNFIYGKIVCFIPKAKTKYFYRF
jgi:hypothetical protein